MFDFLIFASKRRMSEAISILNIPILPEAFLTFASKSSFGPSRYASKEPYTVCTQLCMINCFHKLFPHCALTRRKRNLHKLKKGPPYGRGLTVLFIPVLRVYTQNKAKTVPMGTPHGSLGYTKKSRHAMR